MKSGARLRSHPRQPRKSMNPGEGRSSWRQHAVRRRAPRKGCLTALLLCAALAGCATDRGSVEKNLMSDRESTRRGAGVAETYQVGCPDVLEVRVPLRSQLSGQYAVGPTRRIHLGDYGSVRPEGPPLPTIPRLTPISTP